MQRPMTILSLSSPRDAREPVAVVETLSASMTQYEMAYPLHVEDAAAKVAVEHLSTIIISRP